MNDNFAMTNADLAEAVRDAAAVLRDVPLSSRYEVEGYLHSLMKVQLARAELPYAAALAP